MHGAGIWQLSYVACFPKQMKASGVESMIEVLMVYQMAGKQIDQDKRHLRWDMVQLESTAVHNILGGLHAHSPTAVGHPVTSAVGAYLHGWRPSQTLLPCIKKGAASVNTRFPSKSFGRLWEQPQHRCWQHRAARCDAPKTQAMRSLCDTNEVADLWMPHSINIKRHVPMNQFKGYFFPDWQGPALPRLKSMRLMDDWKHQIGRQGHQTTLCWVMRQLHSVIPATNSCTAQHRLCLHHGRAPPCGW